MTQVLNAWADPATGTITTYERARSGAVIRRHVRGEHVSYLAKSDVDRELLRALRTSRNIAGVTQEGESWVRIVWRTRQAREQACDTEHGWFAKKGIPTFEADVPVVRRWMVDNAIQVARPRRVYLDIETCGRVSISEKEKSRVLCWTLCVERDAESATMVAQGCLERDDDEDEKRLLTELWRALDGYDQVLAWNGDSFDYPVIFARSKLHGIQVDGRRWLWLDHLELFRRMNTSAAESGDEKQSMALNAVAQSVLKEGKTEGVTFDKLFPWWQAGGEKRAALLAYNARDVELMCRIEARTGYVELLHTLCEVTGVFADTHGMQPMPQVESFMLSLGKAEGVHFKTRKRIYDDGESGEGGFKGAFVMDPTLRGIGRDVHVADFSSMYPSIILSWNMSPDTLKPVDPLAWVKSLAGAGPSYLQHLPQKPKEVVIPEGYALAPLTGALFAQEPRGILARALEHLLDMRKHWSAKQGSLPPGTQEWIEAGRRSTAYKVAANSFFGVVGARVSRLYEHDVAESITQAGAWLIRKTIEAAQAAPWSLTVVYGDTDSLFVTGCTAERFREFVAWCNAELYPRLLRAQGCTRNTVRIAYEKQFDRIVFVSAKRYAGRYAHYKGQAASEDSKPEIKGLEYKRGDALRLARRLQAEAIDMLLGGGVEVPAGFGIEVQRRKRTSECVDQVEPFITLVEGYRQRILNEPLRLEDVVLSKRLSKPLREYVTKKKLDGTDGAAPPHVRVARMIEARGGDVRPGTRIEYVVADATAKPARVVPAAEWGDECDRFDLWESYVWPPTERVLAAAFPAALWSGFRKVRPVRPRARAQAAAPALAPAPAPTGGPPGAPSPSPAPQEPQAGLFSLAELGGVPLKKGGQRPRRRA